MAKVKAFNSEYAAQKWKKLTQLSEETFSAIATGQAVQKDYDAIANILAQQSQLAGQIFSEGITAIQAGADDIAAIVKQRVENKGRELTEEELVKLHKAAFTKVFEDKFDVLTVSIGKELAKTQPEVQAALKEFEKTYTDLFNEFVGNLTDKFKGTFAQAKKLAKESAEDSSSSNVKEYADLWQQELDRELKRRKQWFVSRWASDIYTSIISNAKKAWGATKDFYWEGLEEFTKYDVETDALHLKNKQKEAKAEFEAKQENKDMLKSNPEAYNKKLSDYLEQQIAHQKAYLYELKRDNPKEYAKLRKAYIKSSVKASIKYGFSTMGRLFKTLYSRAKDNKSELLATIATSYALYRIIRYDMIPNLLAPIWEKFKDTTTGWTKSLIPDVDSWAEKSGNFIVEKYNGVAESLTGVLDSARGKWDETYDKFFGSEDGSDTSWYKKLWDIVVDFFDVNFVKSIFKTVWNFLIDKLGIGIKNLLSIIPGGEKLAVKVDEIFKGMQFNDAVPMNGSSQKPSAPAFTDVPWEGHRVTSPFGKRTAPNGKASSDHKGIDIAYDVGTPLTSWINGTVTYADPNGTTDAGKYVVIKDKQGNYHQFMHLNKVQVNANDEVSIGDVIGETGNTGNSTGPHLHYAIKTSGGLAVNPTEYWKSKIQATASSADHAGASSAASIPSSNATSTGGAGNLQPSSSPMEKSVPPSGSPSTETSGNASTPSSAQGMPPQLNTRTAVSGAAREGSNLPVVSAINMDFC